MGRISSYAPPKPVLPYLGKGDRVHKYSDIDKLLAQITKKENWFKRLLKRIL